ncbi:MAG: SpoIIE family protein phosphatase [Planctomycetes bacterium]|nr:SpoIIE family protein phosphatase [Planctomycetota bacterium]
MKMLKKQIKREEQIYQITTLVAGGFSLREVLDKLARIAVEITGTNACSIRLLNDESGKLEMRSTFGLSEQYRSKGPVSREDKVIKAAFSGEAVVLEDMRTDQRIKYPEAAKREGIVSQLTVDMRFKDKPVGVLRLYTFKPRHFTEDDVYLVRLVASQCAVAITNAKLYSKALKGARVASQMKLAGVIQRRMIPQQAPKITGLEVASVYKPCFDVGGDLYDFIKLNEHTIAIAIADVIGKGMPAAIMMSSFRGMLRAYADGGHKRHSMHEIIIKLNKTAHAECRNGEFITLFYAIINLRDMTVTYCNCGHEPTLLIRSGRMKPLEKGGMVLGVFENSEYEIETVKIRNDDKLLFYTDGLIDAVNFDNRLWGLDNFYGTVKKFAADAPKDMIRNILRYRRRFIGLAPQADDTSIVAVRINR